MLTMLTKKDYKKLKALYSTFESAVEEEGWEEKCFPGGIGYFGPLVDEEELVENHQFFNTADLSAALDVFSAIKDIRLVNEDRIAAETGLDLGIASLVVAMSDIYGIRTFTSCSSIHRSPHEKYPLVAFWALTIDAMSLVRKAADKAGVEISRIDSGFLACVRKKKDIGRMRDMATVIMDNLRGEAKGKAVPFVFDKKKYMADLKIEREETRQFDIENEAHNKRLIAIRNGDSAALYEHAVAHVAMLDKHLPLSKERLDVGQTLEKWSAEKTFDPALCLKARGGGFGNRLAT